MQNIVAGLTLAACLLPNPAWATLDGCAECTTSLALTHGEAECVVKRIDRLLSRPIEPVYFDASCGQGLGTMSAAVPTITPPSPAAHPDAIWVQLTKKQLTCLKNKLSALAASVTEPIIIELDDAGCPPAKP